jgi:alkylation response protein AidB-like acyl-CoA dehydrogenase
MTEHSTHFTLTEEQRAVADMARAFADEKIAPFAMEWEERKHFPRDLYEAAAELGMGAIAVRDDVGGSGLGRMECALIFEALATGCPAASAFLTIHNMVATAIDRFADDEQRKTWLPRFASMEVMASYCLTEPGSGSDAAALSTRARRDGNGYKLTGVKQFISGAGASDVYLVMARTSDDGAKGISAFLVENGSPGLSFGANEKKMGWHMQPTRQVIMDDVYVDGARRIGAEGEGFRIAMAGLDGGRLNIAACSLGGAQSALDKSLAYVKERKAFGKPIADFQSIQFRLADMATELEVARTFLWRAASALDAKSPDAKKLSAMAKRFVTDAGFTIANNALQIFGGYGYLADYGIEKIVRDLRVHQILEGTNEIMRVIIARDLIGGRA